MGLRDFFAFFEGVSHIFFSVLIVDWVVGNRPLPNEEARVVLEGLRWEDDIGVELGFFGLGLGHFDFFGHFDLFAAVELMFAIHFNFLFVVNEARDKSLNRKLISIFFELTENLNIII